MPNHFANNCQRTLAIQHITKQTTPTSADVEKLSKNIKPITTKGAQKYFKT